MGGTSSERDVSLASGLRIAEALRTRGHTVRAVDTAKGALSLADEQRMLSERVVKQLPPSPEELARMNAESLADTAARLPKRGDCDVAFLALHGGRGEDGTIQALLDLAGVPYTGSGHLPSALAMDKDLSKHLFRAHGVGTANWLMATDPSTPPSAATVERALGWPVIVKPSKQGSTVGLSIVKQPSELARGDRRGVRARRRGDDRAVHRRSGADGGHPGRRSAARRRDHPEARDLRLRVQVHGGDGRGDLSRAADRRTDRRGTGAGAASIRGAQARRMRAHRLPDDERGRVLLSGGEHAARHDGDEPDPAGGGGGGHRVP